MAQQLIGIDIGASYTKVAALEQKTKMFLNNSFVFATPFGIRREGQQEIEAKSFLNEINKSISPKELQAAKIGINIHHSYLAVISVFLPLMNKRELLFAAVNEAKQRMIPASGPEHIFECILLGERTLAKTVKMEVLVIRLEKAQINKLLNIFKDVNIVPALITPSFCALPNIISWEAWKKDESVVFADIGATSINISIYRNGVPVFMRNVSFGLQEIIQDLSRQLSLTEDRIEKVIREQGVPEVSFDLKDKVAIAEEVMRQKYTGSQKEMEAEAEQINTLELKMLWQPHIERIIQELRRSFIFYKEQSEGRRIEKIYFFGGGGQIKNLIPLLTAQIGGECKVILPFSGMQILKEMQIQDEVYSTPIFVGAASLALSMSGLKSAKQAVINFLPKELVENKVAALRKLIFLIIAICLISVFALISIQSFLRNLMMKGDIKEVELKLDKIKDVAGKLKDLEQKRTFINQRITAAEEISRKGRNFIVSLQGLISIIPREILLNELSFSASSMTIKAQVFADYEEANKILEDLRRRLGALGYLSNIKISPLKLEKMPPQADKGVVDGKQGARLTEAQVREFTLTADLVNK